MAEANLISIFSATLSKKRVAELIMQGGDQPLDIQELYKHCFHSDQTIAFRAAWVLETIALTAPERFVPVLDLFLADFPKQDNRSCQRHFTKILMCIQDKKAPQSFREALARSDREALITAVFEWLIDPETPVAVSANCMDILYDFGGEFDWIREELWHQLVILMDRGSPALNSRGKRVFKKLNRK